MKTYEEIFAVLGNEVMATTALAVVSNNDTTRASKMRSLFDAGLTRKQVEEVLDHHNKGEIYNAWHKWSTGEAYGRTSSRRTTTTAPDPTEGWTTYGIEIEAYNAPMSVVADALNEVGLAANYRDDYYHTNGNETFEVKYDGSLCGDCTFELVTPVLTGKEGLHKLDLVTQALDKVNARVNSSTGLHIHLGAKDWTFEQQKNIVRNWSMIQRVLNKYFPASRLNNTYCQQVTPSMTENVDGCQYMDNLWEIFGTGHRDRYHTLNLHSWELHKTFEFRQHQGTTNYVKIRMWLEFLQEFCKWSATYRLQEELTSFDEFEWLTEKQREYMKMTAVVRSLQNDGCTATAKMLADSLSKKGVWFG